jgi:hypothetical protein
VQVSDARRHPQRKQQIVDKLPRSNGLNLGTVLLIIFIVLKLTGAIAWSWLWVLSPLWISVLLALLLFGLAFAFSGAAGLRRISGKSLGRRGSQI